MKRLKQISIWFIAFAAMTLANTARADDNVKPVMHNGSISTCGRMATVLELSWPAATDDVTPQNELEYELLFYKKGSTSTKRVPWIKNLRSYCFHYLEPDTEYWVKIWARDQAGNVSNPISALSSTISSTGDNTNPSGNPSVVANSTVNTISLSWEAGTDNVTPQNELKYKVYWVKKEWSQSLSIPSQKNLLSYTITGLEADTEYTVYINVFDEEGNYHQIGHQTVKTKKDTTKPVPGTLTVGEVTDQSIALSWTAATDNVTPQEELVYQVLYKTGHVTRRSPPGKNMLSYTLTDLQPNTEYLLRIRVRDAAGQYADIVRTVKTTTDTTKPELGTFTVGEVTDHSIALSWTAGTDNITSQNQLQYKLEWAKWTTMHVSTSGYVTNMLSYTITGLKPATKYQVRLIVKDLYGNIKYVDKLIKTKATVVSVTGVTLNPVTLELETRQTANLTASVTPANATNQTVTWSSNNAGVATVNGSGLVKGISSGTAVITVTTADGNHTATCNVTVKTAVTPVVRVTGVTLNPVTLELETGQTGNLSASVSPVNATDQTIMWSSNNAGVATVNGSGLVKGISPGTAVITVTTADGNHTATCNVTVKTGVTPVVKVQSLTLNRTSVTIDGNLSEVQLTVTSVLPANASDRSVTWSSNAPAIASVDGATGKVTIHKKGRARITATANDGGGATASCDFEVISTVSNQTVESLRVWSYGGNLYLSLSTPQIVHVYDLNGIQVKQLMLSAGNHIETLPAGVYLVKSNRWTKKVIVK